MSLPDGMDFIMRPVTSTPPLCRLHELKDGTYDLCDLALMHEALDVREENTHRANKASEPNR